MLLRCESLEPPMPQMGQLRRPHTEHMEFRYPSCGHATEYAQGRCVYHNRL